MVERSAARTFLVLVINVLLFSLVIGSHAIGLPYSIDIILTIATTYLVVEESFPKIFYYLTSWNKLAQYIARDCRQQLICREDTFILNLVVIVVRALIDYLYSRLLIDISGNSYQSSLRNLSFRFPVEYLQLN